MPTTTTLDVGDSKISVEQDIAYAKAMSKLKDKSWLCLTLYSRSVSTRTEVENVSNPSEHSQTAQSHNCVTILFKIISTNYVHNTKLFNSCPTAPMSNCVKNMYIFIKLNRFFQNNSISVRAPQIHGCLFYQIHTRNKNDFVCHCFSFKNRKFFELFVLASYLF